MLELANVLMLRSKDRIVIFVRESIAEKVVGAMMVNAIALQEELEQDVKMFVLKELGVLHACSNVIAGSVVAVTPPPEAAHAESDLPDQLAAVNAPTVDNIESSKIHTSQVRGDCRAKTFVSANGKILRNAMEQQEDAFAKQE